MRIEEKRSGRIASVDPTAAAVPDAYIRIEHSIFLLIINTFFLYLHLPQGNSLEETKVSGNFFKVFFHRWLLSELDIDWCWYGDIVY